MSNDPRGSGSTETRKDDLNALGEVHFGRKPIQPKREELRQFYRAAEPLLDHETVWFRRAHIETIGKALGAVSDARGYTLWACAVCSNHAHVVARTHRDRAEEIWSKLAAAAANVLRDKSLVPQNHPVWSHRPYKVFLYTPDEVVDRIKYVRDNPGKEGLPAQSWSFVKPFPT